MRAIFTERQAWGVFRLAAFSEAAGWSLLISGILLKRYALHGNDTPVLIAGNIHGTIFLAYLAVVLAVWPSLRWKPRRVLVAGLASIPPFGSLVFEQWAARKRQRAALKTRRQITVRALIIDGPKVLAVQPRDTGFWCLPGGEVQAAETAETALVRLLKQQTGLAPTIKGLLYVHEYRHRGVERLELFLVIANANQYAKLNLATIRRRAPQYDEAAFITPDGDHELQPAFLRSGQFFRAARTKTLAATFIHS